MKPKVHWPTIYSRLKRQGLKLKKLGPDFYIVHRQGEILTPAAPLKELEKWSWYRLHGRDYAIEVRP